MTPRPHRSVLFRPPTAFLAALVTLAIAGAGLAAVGSLRGGAATAEASASPSSGANRQTGASATAAPTGDSTHAPPPSRSPAVALVPVVAFWSSQRGTTSGALARTLGGTDPTYSSVIVEATELGPLATLLQVAPDPKVATGTAADVRAAVHGHVGVLGILRATDITPDLRALSVDGESLFGVGRSRDVGDWPLLVPIAPGQTVPTFDVTRTWTLVAAGDVMLDREVYRQAVTLGKGPDWPWDGGTARIVGQVCCDDFGRPLPVAERTGSLGTVRALFHGADLAMVNLEGPAPDAFAYHPSGYVFTMDPVLLTGLADAGVDFVSLGNNHIGNAGAVGVSQTIGHLDALGIGHAGGGLDLAGARQAAWYTESGLRIAVLAYDGTALGVTATATRAGSAPLVQSQVVADIAAARRAGAGLVVVWAHWGTEYTAAVTSRQRALARAMVGAGADLILGDHGHWAGPLQMIGSSLAVYDLGDFIFDLVHSVQTEEALVVELTFVGSRLVQANLHPTLTLDRSQPNLLDPAGDGRTVLDQVQRASVGLLAW